MQFEAKTSTETLAPAGGSFEESKEDGGVHLSWY